MRAPALLLFAVAAIPLSACSSGAAHGSGGSTGSGSTTSTSTTSGAGGQTTGTGGSSPDGGTPTLFYDFVAGDSAAFDQQHPYGAITFGAADPGAHDGQAAALLFKGNTTAVGPGGKATEIGTKSLQGFGEYRFRVRLATCQPNEELVNGAFVYQNDGGDHDGDGLVDNDEIDIEILCGQPGFLNLTSWSQYTDDTHMRKKSRIIDLDTGTIYAGIDDGYGVDESDPATGTKDPALTHPGWYDPAAYYEMGWDWQPDHVRWFMVLGGTEITLWTLTDTVRIPQHPATMRFNLWNPGTHWNEGGTVTPAAKDATLSVDWLSFTMGK